MKKFASLALSAVLGVSLLGCAEKPAAPPPVPVENKPADPAPAAPEGGAAPATEEKKD
jgi:hypothetical protein